MFHVGNSSLSLERKHQKHILVFWCLVDPPLGWKVDIILETKGINARWPHQMEPKRNDWRGDKNLTTFFATKQKGYMNTNKVKEDLNERCQRGPKPKPNPRNWRWRGDQGGNQKPKAPLIGKTWKSWQFFWWCAMPRYKNNDPHLEQRMLY